VIDHKLKVLISSLHQVMKPKDEPKLFQREFSPLPEESEKFEKPEIPRSDWREKYQKVEIKAAYKLEDSADDSELNRMIRLKDFDNTKAIQGEPGRLYFDKVNKKVKIFISETDGWANLDYTLAGTASASPSASPSESPSAST